MRRHERQVGAEGDGAALSMFAPLGHRFFLAIWLANIFSSFGGQIQQVGAAWLMTSMAASAEMIALVTAAATLPILLFSLPSGAIADLIDRRVVLFGAQLLMFFASATLALADFAGIVTPNLLLIATFVIGTGAAINAPAWQAVVGDLVPRAELPAAVGLNIMGFNIARTAGPAAGGLIVALAGAQINFLVNALSYLALIAVLLRWRPAPRVRLGPPETILGAIDGGLRYARYAPAMRRILLRAMCFGLCSSVVVALMALVARDLLGFGPRVFGLLLGFMGAGAVCGASLLSTLRRRFSSERLIRLSIVTTASALFVIGFSRQLEVTCTALFVVGGGMALGLSTFNVAVQLSVPRWVVGRSLATYQMATFGGMTLGAWGWGGLADAFGTNMAYETSALVLLSTLILAWRLPIRDLDAEETASAEPPADMVTPGAHAAEGAGGVVVAIEHRVPVDRIDAFLAAMAIRRHTRRRDGARRWTLLQDANDATLWVERFTVRSWDDHVRQRGRRTQADAAVDARILALHGEAVPVTRYYLQRRAPGV
jgi:MFS family permease